RSSQFLHVSATPEKWEIDHSQGKVAEQLIRPTGLIDPDIEIRPTEGQIPDLYKEIVKRKQKGQRVLVTTLTKRMAEVLTDFLNDDKNVSKFQFSNSNFQKSNEQTVGNEHVRSDNNEQEEIRVAYLHSDVETLDRSEILDDL